MKRCLLLLMLLPALTWAGDPPAKPRYEFKKDHDPDGTGIRPTVEVLDPADNRLIATTPAVSTGTNDWQEMTVNFKAPETSDGVIVRVARSYCGEACPMVGILWLDDFSIFRKS